jgi:hypothetical protein
LNREKRVFGDSKNGRLYLSNRRITDSVRIGGYGQLTLALLAVVAWGFRQVVDGHPLKIEYGYSRFLYPYLAEGVAWIPRSTPQTVSATESALILALIGILAWIGFHLYRAGFRRRPLIRTFLKIMVNGAALLAGLYFVFQMGWGLNYLRAELAEALFSGEETSAASPVNYEGMARDMMALANQLQRQWGDRPTRQWLPDLDPLVDDSIRRTVGLTSPALLSQPPPTKILMADELLSMFGVSGFFSPFFMEPHVNGALLPWELPCVMAHEKAHFMGFASETDANLVAYISCLRSPSDHLRYSEAVRVLLALNRAIGDGRWQELVREGLSERVKKDIRARNERILAHQRRYYRLFKLQRRINDLYLRLNSQELGAASYEAGLNHLVRWWEGRQASGKAAGPLLSPIGVFY